MASQEKRQNPYEIELPKSIIDSFARFLAPEIQNGKRNILIKVRSEVKFKDNMQRDVLFRDILFCRSHGEECFVP